MAGASAPPPPPPPADAAPPRPAPALADCLDLLRGPTDERRLVGLLLAARLLPGEGDAGLRAARGAVGPEFLARLLLPLHEERMDGTAGADGQVRGGRGGRMSVVAGRPPSRPSSPLDSLPTSTAACATRAAPPSRSPSPPPLPSCRARRRRTRRRWRRGGARCDERGRAGGIGRPLAAPFLSSSAQSRDIDPGGALPPRPHPPGLCL
jgi:hypothetical protein